LIDPSAEYTKRLRQRRTLLAESVRKTKTVAGFRLAAGLACFVAIYMVFALHTFSGWFILLPLGAYIGLVVFSLSVYPREQRALRAVGFYERGLARLEDRWIGTGVTSTDFETDGNLYVNDLDIFGEGSLFELLCTARTQSGQRILAQWLSTPATREQILARQQAIEELRNNVDLREDLAILGRDLRNDVRPELITSWAVAPIVLKSTAARVAAPILAALLIAAGIYTWSYGGPPAFFLAAFSAHLAFGGLLHSRVREVVANVESHGREFSVLHATLMRLERNSFTSPLLLELQKDFGSALKDMNSLIRLIVLIEARRNEFFLLFAFILLWNSQLAFAVEAWRERHGASVKNWLRCVGEMEAVCALAGYAFEHPDQPFPEISEGPAVLDADDLRHPLLPRERCVPNSIHLVGQLQLLVISGSNMSGKSTLLRTVGTNVALAQAGAPVNATRMKLSRMAIGATLRVQDSLHSGTSRFYAEIQRLRDIMQLTEGSLPVLLLLDEILYGTNSHDRTIGAEAVIRGLVEKGAIGFVTTHDLALAKVADALAPRAANAHFEDRLEDGKMIFDYVLRPGVVQRSNALELMRAVGLKV